MMKVCVFIFSSLFHIFIFACAIRCICFAAKFIRFNLLVCDTMLFDLGLTAFNCYKSVNFSLTLYASFAAHQLNFDHHNFLMILNPNTCTIISDLCRSV